MVIFKLPKLRTDGFPTNRSFDLISGLNDKQNTLFSLSKEENVIILKFYELIK